jgi:integrase
MSLPKGVTVETLPSGNVRYRYRVRGKPRVTLPGKPFSPEWNRALEAARSGEPLDSKLQWTQKRYGKRSIAALISQYRASPAYRDGRKQSTIRVYERIFKRMVDKNGEKSVAGLTPVVVRQLRDSIESAHTANRYINLLSILMDYACECGWRDTNPCHGVKKRKVEKSSGFHSWTDIEIAHHLACYGEGTRERLALLLHLDTAQRPGDVCRMGPQHLDGSILRLRQSKTGAWLELVLQEVTLAEIARHPLGMAFILTQAGVPFSTKGYQQWFSRRCSDIGLPHCSAHGLRKARSRMEAERGATIKEIQSITGHATSSEVDRYTRAASQRKRAQDVASRGLLLPEPKKIEDE